MADGGTDILRDALENCARQGGRNVWRGLYKKPDGSKIEVIVTIEDHGAGKKLRYCATATSNHGKQVMGTPATTVEEAILSVGIHFNDFDK